MVKVRKRDMVAKARASRRGGGTRCGPVDSFDPQESVEQADEVSIVQVSDGRDRGDDAKGADVVGVRPTGDDGFQDAAGRASVLERELKEAVVVGQDEAGVETAPCCFVEATTASQQRMQQTRVLFSCEPEDSFEDEDG